MACASSFNKGGAGGRGHELGGWHSWDGSYSLWATTTRSPLAPPPGGLPMGPTTSTENGIKFFTNDVFKSVQDIFPTDPSPLPVVLPPPQELVRGG